MGIKSSSLISGGQVTRFISGNQLISSGSAAGVVQTLTPPTGQKVMITALVAETSDCINMQIDIAGVNVFSGVIAAEGTTAIDGISIGRLPVTGSTAPSQAILGGNNEVVEFIRTSTPTNSNIYIQWQYVE